MTVARSQLVDHSSSGIYHCISRCVRRAFLCGGENSDRKQAILDRLRHLATAFAIDVGGYAVMDNHFHVVIRTQPETAGDWSARTVVERWFRLCPDSVREWALSHPSGSGPVDDGTAIDRVATDEQRVEALRKRLSNISWFMKLLKERIARDANREDGCRGHFWEARFKSIRVLGASALLATLIYVDLNVIRSAQAMTPEGSDYTSVQERLEHRRVQNGHPNLDAHQAACLTAADRAPAADERTLWLAPVDGVEHEAGWLAMSVDTYFEALDEAGRIVRDRKKGSIPETIPPILERLGLNRESLASLTRHPDELHGSVAASAIDRTAEALRRGVRWVVGTMRTR
jgi:hypothetical protein